MQYLVFFVIIVIVMVLIYVYSRFGVIIERFTDESEESEVQPVVYSKWLQTVTMKPQDDEETNIINSTSLTTQPFTVYYTKDVEKCNSPGAFYLGNIQNESYKIDYGFDVAYYKALFEKLKTNFNGVNKSPTKEENDVLIELQDTIDQYDKFLDGNKTTCKFTIPNWVNFTPKTEKLLIGDIPQNAPRGLPEHWVTIGKRTDLTQLDTVGVKRMQTPYENPQDYYIKVEGDESTYTLNSLMNYSKDTIKDLYCKEDNGISYNFATGISIDPYTNDVSFVKSGKITSLDDLTDLDIAVYFKSLFQTQSITESTSVETVIIRPDTLTRQILRLRKSICDTIVKELTPIYATLSFTDVAKLKEIQKGLDTKFYQGTSSTLASTDAELSKTISAQQIKIKDAFTTYSDNAGRLQLNQSQVETLTSQIRDIDKIMSKLNATLSNRWSMWTLGYFGRRILRAIVNKVKTMLNTKKGELGLLTSQQAELISTLQTNRNDYASAVDTLNYYMKIKNNINEFLMYMDQTIISNIRQLLAQKSLKVTMSSNTIVPEHLRYLSYDGKLYISLE